MSPRVATLSPSEATVPDDMGLVPELGYLHEPRAVEEVDRCPGAFSLNRALNGTHGEEFVAAVDNADLEERRQAQDPGLPHHHHRLNHILL